MVDSYLAAAINQVTKNEMAKISCSILGWYSEPHDKPYHDE